jgi:hypothetical protein
MHEDALTSIVPAEALGDVGKVGATDLTPAHVWVRRLVLPAPAA